MLSAGDRAPSFSLPDDTGRTVTLASLKGRTVVLYFYPKDDTPGCTTQACGLRDNWAALEQAGAVVLGVSPDSPARHAAFRAKYDLLFALLADEGKLGFDRIVDFTDEITYTLNFRWSLITWAGADGISPTDALSGTGANDGGTNILSEVTAVYGWQQQSQSWLSFFPDGVGVPGANDLTGLEEGAAYWIAIKGPNSITWTVVTDVN